MSVLRRVLRHGVHNGEDGYGNGPEVLLARQGPPGQWRKRKSLIETYLGQAAPLVQDTRVWETDNAAASGAARYLK